MIDKDLDLGPPRGPDHFANAHGEESIDPEVAADIELDADLASFLDLDLDLDLGLGLEAALDVDLDLDEDRLVDGGELR